MLQTLGGLRTDGKILPFPVLEAARKRLRDCDAPLFEGTGDIAESPQIEEIGERIGLFMGDLAFSRREDELSAQALADGSTRFPWSTRRQ